MQDQLTETFQVEKVVYGGDGLVRRADGKTGFVPLTAPGELVEARVVQEKKSFFRALPVQILEPADERVEAPCPYYGRCGGCVYQHLDYPAQLRMKALQVREVLERIGKIPDPPVSETVPSPRQYGYRTRISVHHQRGRLGFYDLLSREIVDITHCPIAEETVNNRLAGLRERLQRRGRVRERVTLRSDSEQEGFSQVNESAREELLRVIADSLPDHGPHLFDAYCGNGLYAFAFAKRFQQVTGIEWAKRSIAQARERSGSDPAFAFHQGDVAQLLPDILRESRPSAIILNPPREGLAEPIPDQLAAATTADGSVLTHITYVSCNPATLARDLRRFLDAAPGRFTLRGVTPVDMFPQTAEVETVVSLVASAD